MKLKVGLAISLMALALGVQAEPAKCPQHFADGQTPEFVRRNLATKATGLCMSGHATMHSGITKTPFWSAYKLTAARVAAGKHLPREDNFHPEPKLPPGERAELSDYRRSGYDRGHVFPNKSAGSKEEQFDSFSLSNIVPQARKHNQELWAGIEIATRTLATQRGTLYVITGVLFEGNLKSIGSGVLVPTHMYKAIYDPVRKQAAAYLSPNSDEQVYEVVSIGALEKRAGFNLFPAMPESVKAAPMKLPPPQMRGGKGGSGGLAKAAAKIFKRY